MARDNNKAVIGAEGPFAWQRLSNDNSSNRRYFHFGHLLSTIFVDKSYYKYEPLLHGPLLYYLESHIYEVFGDSMQVARGIMATLGSFFLLIPWFFRRYLSSQSLLLITSFLASSPLLIYYSNKRQLVLI